jgi:hypothetical protein
MATEAREASRRHRSCGGRRSHSSRISSFLASLQGARLYTLLLGVGALLWLLTRSGTKPTRLSYPCQQSAFGLAAAAFGVPFVAAMAAGGTALRHRLRSTDGRIATVGVVILLLTLVVYGVYEPDSGAALLSPPADHHPSVFVVNNARGVELGRFGGVDDLVTLMGSRGLKWHRSTDSGLTYGPDGLIDRHDVVVIKVNAQWSQRGGTNSDVLRGIIRRIVEHPDGFAGEVVVADNGQGAGSLNRSENNAENTSQSAQAVVNDFANEGWNISTKLWDTIRASAVSEYSTGNMMDGYVVSATPDPETAIRVSYPKFRTSLGTYISYKYGIWNPATQTYDDDRLVVINVPVLKTHSIYGVTASVKNHMGVVTQSLSTDSHYGVGRGGLGSILAEVRMPDLTVLDCIWILARPGLGPSASYAQASRRDQLVASTDPVALDMWAVKNILIPQIEANGYTPAQYAAQNPDDSQSTFRRYLDRSMSEMLAAGIPTTNDPSAFRLHIWDGSQPIPAVSTWGFVVLLGMIMCGGSIILRRRGASN